MSDHDSDGGDAPGDPQPLQQAWIDRLRDLLNQARPERSPARAMAQASGLDPGLDAQRAKAQRAALQASLQRLELRAAALIEAQASRDKAWRALRGPIQQALQGEDPGAAELLLAEADRQLDAWHDELTPEEREAAQKALADRAEADAEAHALRGELEVWVRDFALLRGKTAADKAAFEAQEALVRAAIDQARFGDARQALAAMPPLLRAAESHAASEPDAAAEAKRRRMVLSHLRQRLTDEEQYSLAVARENLDTRNPSPDHNQLDEDLYRGRLASRAAVDATEALLDDPAPGTFNAAARKAQTELTALEKRARDREISLRSVQASQTYVALLPDIAAAMKGVPDQELKQFRDANKARVKTFDLWKGKQQPEQQLRVIAEIAESIQQVQPYVAAKSKVAARIAALGGGQAALPAQLEQLQAMQVAALADADARLVANLGCEGAFDAIEWELTRIEAFVERRKAFDAAAAAARAAWKRLGPHADEGQAQALGPRVEALPATDALHVDNVEAERDGALALAAELDAAEKLLADFRAADQAWGAVPGVCSGKLAPAGKALGLALDTLRAEVKQKGYAATLTWYTRDAASAAQADLKQAAEWLTAAASLAKDPDLSSLVNKDIDAANALVDLHEASSFGRARDAAKTVHQFAGQVAGYVTQRELLRNAVLSLKGGASFEKNLLGLVDDIDATKISDPKSAQARLHNELSPRLEATRKYLDARKPIGAPYNDLARYAPEPQKSLLGRLKLDSEKLAETATTSEALVQAAANMQALAALLPKAKQYVLALSQAQSLLERSRKMAPTGDGTAVKEDDASQVQLEAASGTVANSLDAAAYASAASSLGSLAAALGKRCDQRNAAARQRVKAALPKNSNLAGVIDDLCGRGGTSLPGIQGRSGNECFEALVAAYSPEQLAALMAGLHQGRQAPVDEDPAASAKATGSTLLALMREVDPKSLAELTDEGLGGPDALGQLLHQGFSGTTSQLAELAAAYPDEASRKSLKALLDTGFGGMATMALVVKLGCPSVKRLQALQKSFDPAALRQLMDQGLGGAEALGRVLGTGCKQDAAKLKKLSDKFDNTKLSSLVTNGCDGAANFAGVLGDGCDGDADKLDKLTAPFAAAPADLAKLKELVEHLGNEGAGRKMKTLADRHFGGDVAKFKTPFYDEIAGGGPPAATPAQRKQLIAAASSFECTKPKGNELSPKLDAEKFDKARVEHFLERHTRKHFLFGDKINRKGVSKPNISDDNTQWGTEVTMELLDKVLAAALAATKDEPELSKANRKALARGGSVRKEPVLPAYGVRVRIGYKKYDDGEKLTVDQFFPIAKVGVGTVKDLSIEHFPKAQMKRLKAAIGQ